MDDNVIGKNIKYYCDLYNEKPAALATATRIQKSHISEFIKGDRLPSFDKLEMIAHHFRVSVDDLTESPIEFDLKLRSKVDMDSFEDFIITMMPIYGKSIEDKGFKIALEKHVRIVFGGVKLERMFDEIRIALSMYKKAFEETQSLDAAANSLSLMLYACTVFDRIEALERSKLMSLMTNVEMIDIQLCLKESLLKANEKVDTWNKKREFAEKYKKDIHKYLRALRQSDITSDLHDYFDTLRYFMGLVTSNIKEGVAKCIAVDNLTTAIEMENKYAKEFVVVMMVTFFEISREEILDSLECDEWVPQKGTFSFKNPFINQPQSDILIVARITSQYHMRGGGKMRNNYLQKKISNMHNINKSIMELVMIEGNEETAIQTIETTCLAEMEIFELWAIAISDFIKIKISHFSGDGRIAKLNIKRYGEKPCVAYVEILKKLLKKKEEE